MYTVLLVGSGRRSDVPERISLRPQLRNLRPPDHFAKPDRAMPFKDTRPHERSFGLVKLVLEVFEAFKTRIATLGPPPLNLT